MQSLHVASSMLAEPNEPVWTVGFTSASPEIDVHQQKPAKKAAPKKTSRAARVVVEDSDDDEEEEVK